MQMNTYSSSGSVRWYQEAVEEEPAEHEQNEENQFSLE